MRVRINRLYVLPSKVSRGKDCNIVMIAQHPCPFQSTTVVVSFPGQNLLSLGPSSPTAFTYVEAWHIYASRG